MKKSISILLIFLICVVTLIGRQNSKQVTFQWDPLDDTSITKIRIYDIAQTPEVLVAEVSCTLSPWSCPTTVSATMTKAAHQYTARSVNVEWESVNSNVVAIPGPPQVPPGFTKK